MFEATRLWLKDLLGLEISPENRLATHISVDFSKLSYGLKLQMTNRLRELTPSHSSGICSNKKRLTQKENRQSVYAGWTGRNP